MQILTLILAIAVLATACVVLIYIARQLEEKKRRKLTGIIALFLCILFTISQISFLLFPEERYRNFGGLFGYYISRWIFSIIGLYFFVIPGLLFYFGYLYLLEKEKKDGYHLLYLVPIGVLVDIILSLFLKWTPLKDTASGGYIGKIIKDFLIEFFGYPGTYIIVLFGIITITFMTMKKFIIPQKLKHSKPPDSEKPQVTETVEPPEKIDEETRKEESAKELKEKKIKVRKRKEYPRLDFKTEFLNILAEPAKKIGVDTEILKKEAEILEQRLAEFDVQGKVVNFESGPVITRFEFEPAPGIKVSRIASLDNDLALALKATRVRIVAPIPGKSAVGIEVPNRERSLDYLKSCLLDPKFDNNPSPLAIVLGEDITGNPVSDDISTMPHMLIAGTTGSGKSVCINTIIASLLYHATYRDVRFLMIDPKRLELPMYNPIPHLLRRAITEPKDAVEELEALVEIMESRYRDFARENVRDIDGYNEKMRKKNGDIKPYIVVIVDELADLMLTAPSEIEENITRLAQMSRAVGIHLVLATQRPSVDVITGLIKANFPCRIAFQVASKTDSRTILDMNGAESLLGRGDMLFLPPGKGTPIRLHGAYISTDEVCGISRLIARQYLFELLKDLEDDIEEVITTILDEELWTVFTDQDDPAFEEKKKSLKNIMPEEKIDEIIENGYYPKLGEAMAEETPAAEIREGEVDPMFPEAARLVFRHQVASVSLLQRRLNLGYARAGRIIDQLEAAGIVEPFQGSKSRKVLIQNQDELEAIIAKYQ
ncbi:MAG: DNA translocase FtsK 4TM domain-containing protein [candidate division WOR-3 bacterium]|nr:DNA translocase FtsK 4TM domain-containing protein [candidate division WOR-3 bacterium]